MFFSSALRCNGQRAMRVSRGRLRTNLAVLSTALRAVRRGHEAGFNVIHTPVARKTRKNLARLCEAGSRFDREFYSVPFHP